MLATLMVLLGFEFAPHVVAQSSRPGWGSTPYHDALGTGVTFRVWAPDASSVFVPGQFNSWSTTATPLVKELTNGSWTGIWSGDVTTASTGQQYKYFLNYNGTGYWRHDPRARMVVNSSSGANDIIYDPTNFNWSGDSLPAPAISDLVIYELHIGTFYDPRGGSLPGRFIDATNKLDYLKNLGVNAVELMPISEFPGTSSWGYNPADIFAADNNAYGGPDGFKTFVKACHARGLAVLLDVVHNHYGPTDLDLWDFDGYAGGGNGGGIYFYQNSPQCCTSYGSRPNYGSQQVSNFIQQNFQMWMDECHVDGFRWDTPGLMLNAGSTYIPEAGALISAVNGMIHTNYPGRITISEDVYNAFGFDSAWDTSYPGYILQVLTNTSDSSRDMTVLSDALQYNIRYGGTASTARVAFAESHDVVGDLNGGTRLVTAIDPATPNSYRARKLSTLGALIAMTGSGIPMIFQGQEMLENQQFSSGRPVDWTKTNTYSGIVRMYRDLVRQRRNLDGDSPGMEGNQISVINADNSAKVLQYQRWQSGTTNYVVVVANFSNTTRLNYNVQFPLNGAWYAHFNSDSTNYGTDFSNVVTTAVTATGGSHLAPVNIGPYSAIIFSQIPFPPSLSVSQTNGVVTVSWPTNFGGWKLDSAPKINGTPTQWTAVSSSLYHTNAGAVCYSVTPGATNAFYRLREF